MIAAQGILTSRGGKTSHAAVVARGMGKTCVCGAEALDVDDDGRHVHRGRRRRSSEGDVISIDGTTGRVYLGEVPVAAVAGRASTSRATLDAGRRRRWSRPCDRLLAHADEVRRLRRAGQRRHRRRTPRGPAGSAPQGIGLCRTEHMFLGDRRELVERLILADADDEREAALDALLPLQRDGLRRASSARWTACRSPIRLHRPAAARVPARPGRSCRSRWRVAEATRRRPGATTASCSPRCAGMHEQNPMLGLRGVRLGLVIPGLFAMQVRAIAEAAAERRPQGGDPRPEIMVPLVGAVQELETVRAEAEQVLAEVAADRPTSTR